MAGELVNGVFPAERTLFADEMAQEIGKGSVRSRVVLALGQSALGCQREAVGDDAARGVAGDIEEVFLGDVLGQHPGSGFFFDQDIDHRVVRILLPPPADFGKARTG